MRYLSECCGEEMPNWPDNDLCQECKEHCGVYLEEDEEDIPLEEFNSSILDEYSYLPYDNASDFEIGREA